MDCLCEEILKFFCDLEESELFWQLQSVDGICFGQVLGLFFKFLHGLLMHFPRGLLFAQLELPGS